LRAEGNLVREENPMIRGLSSSGGTGSDRAKINLDI